MGKTNTVPSDYWTMVDYTAALNCKNLSPTTPLLSWCPKGNCGTCWKLCTTGGSVTGRSAAPGVCRIFKISNRCGDGYPN